MAEETFVWGSGGSKESLERRRKVAEALMLRGSDTSPVQHWTQGLARVADAITGRMEIDKLDKDAKAGQAALTGDVALAGGMPPSLSTSSTSGVPKVTIGDPTEIENTFVNGVKNAGLTNPIGLAAVAAYGNAESQYSPANVNRTWSDPSERGQAGTSGGIMSWRDDRLRNLFRFAQGRGEQPGAISPATQAAFFASEDPTLIPRLNAAKSPDEANQIMAGAWRFAGHDRPGQGEYARRLALTQAYANRYGQSRVAAADAPAPGASPVEAETGAPGFFVPPGPGSDALPIMQPGGALPNFDQDSGRWLGPSNPPALAAAPAQPDIAAPEAPTATQPLAPVFMSEGVSQPWMNSAIMPEPPAPQVAQTTLPPRRPADLTMPEADVRPPTGAPAMAQAVPLPAPMAIDPNSNDAGGRFTAGGGANAPVSDSGTIFDRIAAAMGGRTAPSAAATPSPAVARVAAAMPASDPQTTASTPSPAVERVAAAMPGANAQLLAAQRIVNSPYANSGQRAIAQAVIERSIKGTDFESVTRPDGSVWRVPKTGNGAPTQVFGPQSKPQEPGSTVQLFRDEKDGSIVAVDKSKAGAGTGSELVRPGKPRPDDNMDAESKLRNEFSGRLKDFGTVQDAYGRIVASVENRATNPQEKSPASDIALVFGYMKMLDPGSVVREGEYATAQNAAGIPERIRNYYNKAIDGEFLDPKQRNDMLGTAQRLYKQARGAADAEGKRYRDLATSYGLQPDRVVAMPGMIEMPQIGPTATTAPSGATASPPAAAPAGVAAPKSKAEYDALPSGTRYVDPNGQPRTKP